MQNALKLVSFVCLGLIMCGGDLLHASYADRPVPEGGGPTLVECLIGVTDVDAISDAEQNFTVRAYLVARWKDPRLSHEGPGPLRMELEEVWHPDLSILNQQRVWSEDGDHVEVTSEGWVTIRRRLWGDFSQPLDLHDFPFDDQSFQIQLISVGGWSIDEVKLVAAYEVPSFVTEDYSVADWKIGKYKTWEGTYAVPGSRAVASFALQFEATRLKQHYMIKILAPLFMIVCLSWVVFWIDPKDGGSQIGVSVTAFLTMIAYYVALSSRLPKIPYLTRLDVFVFIATLLVFIAMIEVVITTGLAKSGRIAGARWLDRSCRVVFPGLLALAAVYAFAWH